jgi:hypothetical protein
LLPQLPAGQLRALGVAQNHGHHEPHFCDTRHSDQRTCAAGKLAIHRSSGTDDSTKSNDDGNRFSACQVRCLHRLQGQGLWPLYGEGLFQHHQRELRLQSTERVRSAMGMCGDSHMQEIDAYHSSLPYWLKIL